jgi:ankyrin repeat protein
VLLDQEARIGAKDKNKQTALHFAAAKAHNQMIELLFHRGADKEAKDGEGQTALHLAASNGHNTTLQMLIKTLSVDKEAKDGEGRTALHHAASNGHNITLQMLIKTFSVDKEAKDSAGQTALHHAASNGHDTSLRILIETLSVDKEATDGEGDKNHTAAINTTDNNQCTPLHIAIMFGHENAAVLLSNMYNKENGPQMMPPFLIAIWFGRTHMVKLWVVGVDKRDIERTIKFARQL